MSYYETFKEKADERAKEHFKTVSDLKKQIPRVKKRLADEKKNKDNLAGRLTKLDDLSIESLAGGQGEFDRYKVSMKKLNVELAVSEEIVNNIETKILPNAESRLKDAETNLSIVLSQLIHETRPVADEKINAHLRNCIIERENFLDAWRTIYGDFGLNLIVSDEALCPSPWTASEIRDMKLRLNMPTTDEPPVPALPLEGIYGVPESPVSDDNLKTGNNAPNSDDICEQERKSESEKIPIDVSE